MSKTIHPSEVPEQAEFFKSNKSYQETLWDYISTLEEDELEVQSSMAATLLKDGPLQRVTAIIPVHTDDIGLVDNALSQYERQRYPAATETEVLPFTIYLGLNGKIAEQEASSLLDHVREIASSHPRLDVRLTYQQYDPETIRIGKIRRDMWNAVALADTKLEQNTMCVNHDIDVESLPYFYMSSISQWADNPHSTEMPVFSQMRFAQAPDSMPNMQKFILWKNFQDRQTRHLFEQGLVIPLKYYSAMGGFDPTADMFEGYYLIVGDMQELKTGYLQTSPRRQIEYGFGGAAYSQGFNVNERYRLARTNKDITEGTLVAALRKPSATIPLLPIKLAEYSPETVLPNDASPEDREAYRKKIEDDALSILRHRASIGSRVLRTINLKDMPPEIYKLYPSSDKDLIDFDRTYAKRFASSILSRKTNR